MWWQLCTMETAVGTLRAFNIWVVWVCDSSFYVILVELCVPDPKMFICTDNVANQEVFQISFPQFERQNVKLCIHNWWKKMLNTVSSQYVLLLCNSVFPLWHLRCSRRWGFIMLCGFGHCIVWCIVVNVLEELSGCIFTGRRKMDAPCPDRNFGTHQSDYMVP
jgi:hypothetical protein